MRKYLMTGVAAIALCAAFTSCSSKDELYNPEVVKGISTEQEIANVYEQYNRAFIATFGQPAANQDWGFGSTRTRANAGENYPATSTGINANANEWADPDKQFGGWNVPARLTDRQKLRVYRYFQTHPNLQYKDPEWRHFFVQQCYTGGDDQYGESTENITAANTTTYTSGNMNLLTVGKNEQHINNFNAGGYGVEDGEDKGATGVNVLDNGQHVGGTSHTDQIMLMVNIDDTSCFGYHETGCSKQRNDKMALVSAAEIDRWAANEGKDLGIDLGDAVVDDWNRSFLGFDHALYTKEEAAMKNWQTGEVMYATYDQAPGQPKFAWDGTQVIAMYDANNNLKDEFRNILNTPWLDTNSNFYVSAGTVNLNQTSSSLNGGKISDQDWDDIKDYVVFEDAYADANNTKTKVLNYKRIKELVENDYMPIYNKSLQEWVKFGYGDGYFTDWIVTLTKAERQDGKTYVDRIICEDLNAKAANSDPAESGLEDSDWDFNDVVFDVRYEDANTACIKIRVIGGVLPLYVGGHEIHELCGQKVGSDGNYTIVGATDAIAEFKVTIDGVQASHGKLIPIKVKRPLADGEEEYFDMTAEVGKPAAKIRVDPKTFKPCAEREDIRTQYPEFSSWVKNPIVVWY